MLSIKGGYTKLWQSCLSDTDHLSVILLQGWPSYIKLTIIVFIRAVYNIIISEFFKNFFLIVIIDVNN